ncbi:MAG: hypothetical protein ACI4T7_08845 [Alloprevotella sp.]
MAQSSHTSGAFAPHQWRVRSTPVARSLHAQDATASRPWGDENKGAKNEQLLWKNNFLGTPQ